MLRKRPVIAVLLWLLGQPSLHAQPTWSPPSGLDPRDPIEIAAQSTLDPTAAILHAPVLFAGAPNALEVVRVDVSVFPPTASPVPVATGNIFALGTMVSIPGEEGFSFVDGGFDARFGHCAPPCDNATNSPVVSGTFVDSDSAASANQFWVAALNNTVPRRLEIRTSPDGLVWTPLYNYTPPETGGVCGQYNGCGRINLVVDPTATDVASALSCLTFDVKTSATTTERRILCFVGSAPQVVTLIDTDIPYADPVLDRLTDTELYALLSDVMLDSAIGAYNHRQTNTVRAFQFNPTTLALAGPVELGPAPLGSDPFGLSGVPVGGGAYRTLWSSAAGSGQPAYDFEWDPAIDVVLPRPGPPAESGPVSASAVNGFMMALLGGPPPLSLQDPHGGTGLAISSCPLPFFDDGFETGNTLRWSATSP